MGVVKDAIKGSPPAKDKGGNANIIQQVTDIKDQLAALTAKKDDDVATEGDAAKPENSRKAAVLRATYSLLLAAKNLLEDY